MQHGKTAWLILFVWSLMATMGPNLLWADETRSDATKNTYVSETDKMLTIHRVGVLPSTDNVSGLYSRYVENKLNDLVKGTHRFDFIEIKDADAKTTLEDYEHNSGLVKSLGKKNHVDALLTAQIAKHSKTVDLTLDLFLTTDGNLFLQEQLNDTPRFEITDIEKTIADLYGKMIGKIPYKGLVLSRQGNRVTIDIGARDGITGNIIVSIEQIISIKRHPKYKFLLSSEKEIMGKIKILKVDETLSFGAILQEKEHGVIGADSKVTGLDFITYSEMGPDTLKNVSSKNDPLNNPVSFGKGAKEWLPAKQPSFGKIGFGLALGSYHSNLAVSHTNPGSPTPNDSYTGDVPIYPQLELSGEIWLTPNWFMAAAIEQAVLSINNPQSSSSPTRLGANTGHYDLHLGYKFLLQDDFWGPQINTHMGFGKYSLFVDASTPLTFVSTSYSGLYVGLGGMVPISSDRTYYLEVNLDRFIFPSLEETPASSGAAADNNITHFSIGGGYKLNTQFRIVARISFEFYSSTFSGTGSRSASTPNLNDVGLNASQSLTTLTTGLEYLF